jgi:undecaprenyl-diphosphatase
MIDKIIEFDTQLFLYLNSLNSALFDKIMWIISGRYEWIPLYAGIIFFIFKKFKLKGFIPLLFIVLCIVFADQISVHLFKDLFHRLRPCHNPDIVNIVHIVNNKCGGQYGFVSSHATNSFALAGFTFLLFNKKHYSIGIFIWASIVSYSRIYLGVHYPLDVICGAILGLFIGIILFWIFKKTNIKLFSITDKKHL